MRAIVIEQQGRPGRPRATADEPEPDAGRRRTAGRGRGVGVNYRDVYEREGRGAAYGNAKVPLIVGAEGAGTVLRGAGEFAEGERVGGRRRPA